MGEAAGTEQASFQDYLLRELMSEGRLRYPVPQKVGNDIVGQNSHGDIFKMVFAIHDFFPRLSFCTIGTEGNPQTLVWREPRQDFRPRFNSLETVSRMSWFEMRRNFELMRVMPEEEALALVTARLGA